MPRPDWSDRLVSIREQLGLSQEEMAAQLSVPYRTYQGYEQGRTPPKLATMLALCEMGFSIDWLLTGEEPAQPQAPAQTPDPAAQQPLDPELYGRIVDGISKTYREIGARIQPVDLGRLAARMATELMEIYDDPDDRLIGLKALLRRLRADLLAAPQADTTSSKRQA